MIEYLNVSKNFKRKQYLIKITKYSIKIKKNPKEIKMKGT